MWICYQQIVLCYKERTVVVWLQEKLQHDIHRWLTYIYIYISVCVCVCKRKCHKAICQVFSKMKLNHVMASDIYTILQVRCIHRSTDFADKNKKTKNATVLSMHVYFIVCIKLLLKQNINSSYLMQRFKYLYFKEWAHTCFPSPCNYFLHQKRTKSLLSTIIGTKSIAWQWRNVLEIHILRNGLQLDRNPWVAGLFQCRDHISRYGD